MVTSTAQDDAIEQRRATVAELMLNGWSAPKIARHLGTHHETIYRDVTAIRAQWRENQTHSYTEWIERELQRLDSLEEKLDPRLSTGDPQALQVALRIQERRAKYLALDQPTRIVIDDGLTAEIRELAEQLGMTDTPAVQEILNAGNR